MTITQAFELPRFDGSGAVTAQHLPTPAEIGRLLSPRNAPKPPENLVAAAQRLAACEAMEQEALVKQLAAEWLPAARTLSDVAPGDEVYAASEVVRAAVDAGLLPLGSLEDFLVQHGYAEQASVECDLREGVADAGLLALVLRARGSEDLREIEAGLAALPECEKQLLGPLPRLLAVRHMMALLDEPTGDEISGEALSTADLVLARRDLTPLERAFGHEAMTSAMIDTEPYAAVRHACLALLGAQSFAGLELRTELSVQLLDALTAAEMPDHLDTAITALRDLADELSGEMRINLCMRLSSACLELGRRGNAVRFLLAAADTARHLPGSDFHRAELHARVQAARLFLDMSLPDRCAATCRTVVRRVEKSLEHAWAGWEYAVESLVMLVICEGAALHDAPRIPSPVDGSGLPSRERLATLVSHTRRTIERAPTAMGERARFWAVYLDDRYATLLAMNGDMRVAQRCARAAIRGWAALGEDGHRHRLSVDYACMLADGGQVEKARELVANEIGWLAEQDADDSHLVSLLASWD
ncbi:hypothetical protein ACUH94_07515 [Dermabacteraceae bacterium P7074]